MLTFTTPAFHMLRQLLPFISRKTVSPLSVWVCRKRVHLNFGNWFYQAPSCCTIKRLPY